MDLAFVFPLPQKAVTVKEALTAKGKHLRRSVSTPNVQHVMHRSVSALDREQYNNNTEQFNSCNTLLSHSPVLMQ